MIQASCGWDSILGHLSTAEVKNATAPGPKVRSFERQLADPAPQDPEQERHRAALGDLLAMGVERLPQGFRALRPVFEADDLNRTISSGGRCQQIFQGHELAVRRVGIEQGAVSLDLLQVATDPVPVS